MKFAPQTFRSTRIQTTKDVEAALHATGNITNIQPAVIRQHPEVLATLRMSTCPPLAVDRLIGLAGVPTGLVKCMELEKKLPPRMPAADIDRALGKIAKIIEKMADPDIFVWLGRNPKTERRLFLLDTRLSEDEIKTRFPSLWTYLEEGSGRGLWATHTMNP